MRRGLANMCLPVKIYVIVMIAVVLFDVYLGSIKHVVSNTISLFVGALFLWILCAANLDFAAYGLLVLPVIFFFFLFAIIVYDQSLLSIRREYEQSLGKSGSCVETCPTPKPKPTCPKKCPTNRCCQKKRCECMS